MKILLMFFAATLCFAQQDLATAVQPKYYKFDFVVKELDGGKVQSARTYSVMGRQQPRESIVIRAGEKVPVATAGGASTFIDVGVNIDTRILSESTSEMGLSVSADISSADARNPPVITTVRWNSTVLVPLRKATVIFSSESPTKKVQTQLEVTVTPLQ
jgi:hypothetical protein